MWKYILKWTTIFMVSYYPTEGDRKTTYTYGQNQTETFRRDKAISDYVDLQRREKGENIFMRDNLLRYNGSVKIEAERVSKIKLDSIYIP